MICHNCKNLITYIIGTNTNGAKCKYGLEIYNYTKCSHFIKKRSIDSLK